MRALIVGLGSMGKRRIRNLHYLKAGEVMGFDPRAERRAEVEQHYGIRTFRTFEEALAGNPDAIVISTPPDLHMPYAKIASERQLHFFTEASVVADGMEEIIRLSHGQAFVAAPSCTMRFHHSVKKMKELVGSGDIGEILCMTHHVGQYLPDWHPWEDYRTFYVSRRETGAAREMVSFELVWLTWLLGEVTAVTCFKGKVSALEAEIDDVYQILLRFGSKTLGHLLVDVVARTPYRTCRLLGSEGVIEWDLNNRAVRLFRAIDKNWQEFPEPAPIAEAGYIHGENMYIEEMACFIGAVRGETRYPYNFSEDKRILDLLNAAEQSSTTHTHVNV